jgi:hypothetical protein
VFSSVSVDGVRYRTQSVSVPPPECSSGSCNSLWGMNRIKAPGACLLCLLGGWHMKHARPLPWQLHPASLHLIAKCKVFMHMLTCISPLHSTPLHCFHAALWPTIPNFPFTSLTKKGTIIDDGADMNHNDLRSQVDTANSVTFSCMFALLYFLCAA